MMSERTRYTWGESSLGDFFAAISDEGLVAFEFIKRSGGVPATLRERCPEADIDLDEAGLADVVGKLAAVVERPDIDPGLRLDMRGSDYQKKVWGILRRIPSGQTINYGAVAAEMGTPRDARDVTDAIANNMIAILILCQRVVKKDGSLRGVDGSKAQARTVGT
jgi:AraC family transcriptional regulator of adaptative response/methylated-DNA-[protein]-cysteine methyltransferase